MGFVFIAGLAALCWADHVRLLGAPTGAWLIPLALLLSYLASDELLWLMAPYHPQRSLVQIGSLLIVTSIAVPHLLPDDWLRQSVGQTIDSSMASFAMLVIVFVLCSIAAVVAEMVRFEKPGQATIHLALTILCFVYVGLLMAFVVQLRMEHGMLALLSLVVVVKMGDTGAYTVGRLVGRHKMTPRLSPGKTWEGAAGAMAFAVLGAWALFEVVAPRVRGSGADSLEPWQWIAFGLIVGSAGLLGDLAESLLKRDAGRKDSSPWMPGFGGMLDVLDSILLAAPVAYLAWMARLVH